MRDYVNGLSVIFIVHIFHIFFSSLFERSSPDAEQCLEADFSLVNAPFLKIMINLTIALHDKHIL